MPSPQVEEEIAKLSEQISKHNVYYHALDAPKISDQEYDKLFNRLLELEEKYPQYVSEQSPTQRVGATPSTHFQTVLHEKPMLSLEKCFSEIDIQKWDKRNRKLIDANKALDYVCEPKIDGIAITLLYKKGVLVQGATRGDGKNGEDITANLRTVRNIPLKLYGADVPELLEVRGELYMPLKAFRLYNENANKKAEKVLQNPRNGAAGSVRQLDPKVTSMRPLKFFAHGIGQISESVTIFNQHSIVLESLERWGFTVNKEIGYGNRLDDCIQYIHRIEKKRLKLNYDIDGIVIKVNDLELQEALGVLAHAPRYAIAYKFTALQAETILNNVLFQTGRTSVITPVAEVKAVELGGVTIERVTLHNFAEIERLGLSIGDIVVLSRMGDVIPKIIKKSDNQEASKVKRIKIEAPTQCPGCKGKVTMLDGGIAKCNAESNICPSQLQQGVLHFVSRLAMDIEGVGEKLVTQLIEKALITNVADLYALKVHDLSALERMGKKSAENVINSIEKSKQCQLQRFLYALGIEHVGEVTALSLAKEYITLKACIGASCEQLEEVPEVGGVIADSVYKFFRDEINVGIINKLQERGVQVQDYESSEQSVSKYSGEQWVVTGKLKHYSRTEIKKELAKQNVRVTSIPSSQVNRMLIGEAPSESKMKKAKALDIPIIQEDTFIQNIN